MQAQELDAKTLKERHRLVRDTQPEDLRVRIHRAISWLARAEQESDDRDAHFVFLWIALSAAYAKEFGFERSEREQVRAFVDKVVGYEKAGRLQDAVCR